MYDSTCALLEYSAGRNPERLTRKLNAIATDPLSFLYDTNNLYTAFLADATSLRDAPHTLVCSGLHPENFDSFKDGSGLVYFDMNDFDGASAAPLTVDLVRALSSLQVASFG